VTERVLGIGGVFFRARDPDALRAWYAEHLGIELEPSGAAVLEAKNGDATVWYVSSADDEYFGAPGQSVMINYRVRDLDAMLAQLRASGVPVDDQRHEDDNGRFGWVTDPEGNRIELWQPSSD
jgi:predicted enzyme related to lactoylglutathione lyase